jgi:SAM-dependent methyltransferase
MKYELQSLLVCPQCRFELTLSVQGEESGEVKHGTLTCNGCSTGYPIIDFIPRFVAAENYARNFGFQWNRFRKTQLDSHTGVPISRERLFFSSEWKPEEMNLKWVLDVGCGAGRFAEVALSTGARLVAVDYSAAVDACWSNLGPHPRLDVVQADIYRLPFRSVSFDFVYCLGVLQHTPDVKRAFMALPEQVKPNGKVAVDVYPRLILNALWPKYWLRPITKRMDQRKLFRVVERLVPWLLPVSDMIARIPVIGRKLRYAIPVANHGPDYPHLSREQIGEWAVLNTYDMFGPAYDQPQSARTLAEWFREAGLREVRVYRKGHLCGHGVR